MSKSDPPSEKNQALVANARKGKGRKFPYKKNKDKRLASDQDQRTMDLSKIRCFNCQNFGHFVARCPEKTKRKGKQHALVVDVDDQP